MLEVLEILDKGGVVPAGTLSKLLKHGIIPTSIVCKHQMYQRYIMHYQQMISINVDAPQMTAITLTSEEFKCSIMSVYRAITLMEL